MTNYQKRFQIAFDQWIERGAPPSAARDLAHEQLTFEDERYKRLEASTQENKPITLNRRVMCQYFTHNFDI
jgi:hypothetical protein